jgi:hypothetical protein
MCTLASTKLYPNYQKGFKYSLEVSNELNIHNIFITSKGWIMWIILGVDFCNRFVPNIVITIKMVS